MENFTKKFKIIGSIIAILIITLSGYLIYKNVHKDTSVPNEDILDLSKIPVKDRDNRYRLLLAMTDTSFANYADYESRNSYSLNDQDPSIKVLIGTYSADSPGKSGGIVMLRHLENGKFSIYWEITSPMFWAPAAPRKILQDINGDGLKELITYWESYLGSNEDTITQYWIITLDSKNKTYKVLNPLIDKNKNPITDFDFANLQPDPNNLNRLQTNSLQMDILHDIDNDGIPEVIINTPVLEDFNIVSVSTDMVGKGRHYNQIYKWDGTKYYLWKETTESIGSN